MGGGGGVFFIFHFLLSCYFLLNSWDFIYIPEGRGVKNKLSLLYFVLVFNSLTVNYKRVEVQTSSTSEQVNVTVRGDINIARAQNKQKNIFYSFQSYIFIPWFPP
jgi:hypothetical protein